MKQIEYWQTSLDTKINVSDAFLSDLCVKYCEQKNNALEVKKAVQFSEKVYRVQQLFNELRGLLRKASIDNTELLMRNNQIQARLIQFEQTDKAMENVSRAEVEKQIKDELEQEFNNKVLKFKDKYQIRIQELEIENDQLLKQLIKQNR